MRLVTNALICYQQNPAASITSSSKLRGNISLRFQMNLADLCVPHLKVPLPSSSLISRLTLKVNRSLSGVSGGACCDDSSAFLAERRKAVAKLYNILLTCGREARNTVRRRLILWTFCSLCQL